VNGGRPDRCWRRGLAGLALVGLLVGCAGDDAPTRPTAEPAATEAEPPPEPETRPVLPVTLVDDTGREVTVTSAERIIPVNGDLAEVVFSLGLGEQVRPPTCRPPSPPRPTPSPRSGTNGPSRPSRSWPWAPP
jgi:iron complex transport system substrate-binding protein